MINNLLTASNTKLKVDATNWQDAIRKGGELLVNSGMTEPRYVDAMIENANKNGPYFVLVPGVAMPHARSECGAIKIGLSLITLKEPVNFLNSPNNPVSIVLCLSATDPNSHIQVMQNLAEFLDSKDDMNAVINANKTEEVMQVMQKY